MSPASMPSCILFDWGDTLMRVFDYPGKMKDWPKLEAVPRAREMLEALRDRVDVALATNAADSDEADIREALARVGLEVFFAQIYCYRTVGHKKSSPPFFAHVLLDQGLQPEQVVMVGDDFQQDVEAALACGMNAVWFNERTSETRAGQGFATIHSLNELPRVLEEWQFLA